MSLMTLYLLINIGHKSVFHILAIFLISAMHIGMYLFFKAKVFMCPGKIPKSGVNMTTIIRGPKLQ